jgi:hypothetical protein
MTTRIIALAFASALAVGACSEGDSGGADSGTEIIDPPAVALYGDSAPLTELGEAAIAIAPAWLRHDLGLALRQQEAARADELAALLTDAADPRTVDEIAFSIAHTSPEVMASESFYPELFALNAELIYEHDAMLDYVELGDPGVAGTDDAFWTTATYTYMQKGGGLVEKTIDRDIYYWFVVHPKMEDESPWFIDSWTACSNSTTRECAATPDEGWFWREFLWDTADDTCPEAGMCPTLDAWLPGVEYVWNGRQGGNASGAINEIVEFMRFQPVEGENWLDFDSGLERSIQPNRIYGLGQGRCGEWADMTTALARTALIPNANASPASWDHTWNAFFDETWVEWEPVNYAIDTDYSGWGASFDASNSFYIARGDGLVLLQTPDYRDDIFTMEIEVLDVDGAPVPGASVSVWAPIPDSDYWSYAGEGPTDGDGVASFPLVAMRKYAIRIVTPIGTWPEGSNITYASDGIAIGETDVQSYNLTVALPTPLAAAAVGFADEPEAALHLGFQDLGGRFTPFGQRFGTTYTVEAPAPELQVLLVDEANLALLEAGSAFEAAWIGGAADADVEIPLDGTWYLVLSNAAQVSTAAFGTLNIDATPLVDGAWTGPATPLELPYEILPGGKLIVGVTPAAE